MQFKTLNIVIKDFEPNVFSDVSFAFKSLHGQRIITLVLHEQRIMTLVVLLSEMFYSKKNFGHLTSDYL